MQRQRNHGHNAALTAIIRTHDKHDVFDRNDDNQGPQDERKNPEQVIRGQRNRVDSGKDFFHRVQRTGTDISVNHTQRS